MTIHYESNKLLCCWIIARQTPLYNSSYLRGHGMRTLRSASTGRHTDQYFLLNRIYMIYWIIFIFFLKKNMKSIRLRRREQVLVLFCWKRICFTDSFQKPENSVNPVKDKNTLNSLYSSASWITCLDGLQLEAGQYRWDIVHLRSGRMQNSFLHLSDRWNFKMSHLTSVVPWYNQTACYCNFFKYKLQFSKEPFSYSFYTGYVWHIFPLLILLNFIPVDFIKIFRQLHYPVNKFK